VRWHIVARLARFSLAAAMPRQVGNLARELSATAAAGNAVIARLSHGHTVMAQWGLVSAEINPCRSVPGYRRRARERFLTDVECERQGRVLQAAWDESSPGRSAVAAAVSPANDMPPGMKSVTLYVGVQAKRVPEPACPDPQLSVATGSLKRSPMAVGHDKISCTRIATFSTATSPRPHLIALTSARSAVSSPCCTPKSDRGAIGRQDRDRWISG